MGDSNFNGMSYFMRVVIVRLFHTIFFVLGQLTFEKYIKVCVIYVEVCLIQCYQLSDLTIHISGFIVPLVEIKFFDYKSAKINILISFMLNIIKSFMKGLVRLVYIGCRLSL